MSPRKPKDETEGGRWSVQVGDYGSIVRVRERTPGGRVQLHYADPGTGKRRSVYTRTRRVRDERGRLVRDACRQATAEGEELATRLAYARLSAEIQPTRLTVAQAFARYHDEERGGLPRSRQARTHHAAARAFWTDWLKPDTPWNRIVPSDVTAGANKLRDQGKIPTAEKWVRCLRTTYRWLTDRAGLEGLKDPTRGFDLQKLREGHEVRRPRYRGSMLPDLIAVAHEIDPRFRFALIWAFHSGARSAALYRAWRSHVDEPLDVMPEPADAPFGHANLPAMKGQDRALTYLTWWQRLEFVRATWKRWNGVRWVDGYLSELERAWLEEGRDYPLIPGGYFPSDGVFRGQLKPLSNKIMGVWLRRAEVAAGIPHVDRLGWHGIRRAWADYTADATDLDTVVAAGAWSDREMPERVYMEKVRHARLARSRAAQEERER